MSFTPLWASEIKVERTFKLVGQVRVPFRQQNVDMHMLVLVGLPSS